MHPEMSLVLLTVLAGAGQGLFILLVALDSVFHGTGSLPTAFIYAGGIVSVALQVAGIITSTSHLGNPQRGWRAALMIKNSWLSREVITLSLSVGCALLYLFLSWQGAPYSLRITAGIVGVLANIGFYISSAQVYGSVRFIREWANGFTPANFFLFGITSGFAAGLAVLHSTNADSTIIYGISRLLMVMGTVSLIMKIMAYRFNASAYVSVNIKNAVGVNDPDIRLMDSGTSYAHYNTKEYFFPISGERNKAQQISVIVIAFLVPLLMWGILLSHGSIPFRNLFSTLAALSMIAGLILERRLFFIHGNSLQNLYYANFRAAESKNPLVRRAKKGTPVPTP